MAGREKEAKNRTNIYRTQVQGNVVRKVYAEPPYHQEEVQHPERVHHRRHKKNTLSIPYCAFLTVACVLVLGVGAEYLQQQAVNVSSQKTIASMESQLTEKKKVNADNLNRIEASIDLDEIRRIAIEDLGMVYATEDNVILYKNTSRNYVSQYEEIPQEEKLP